MIYVYTNDHSHALANLKYFLDRAVREGDGVDYYFIIQHVNNRKVNGSELPILPASNAHYFQHENQCGDFGTVGWFLERFTYGNPWLNQTSLRRSERRGKIDLKKYKYFLVMNSSIRGPFFPPYFVDVLADRTNKYYWYSIFTKRLNENVKLVGCTISCEVFPHVQTYLFATDFIGFNLLLKAGTWGSTTEKGIFACYSSKENVTFNGELSVSNRILGSGYMIDSLLTKYQTVNFSQPQNRNCNQNKDPSKDKAFQGTSLEPFEVVFVKYNDLEFFTEPRDKAKIYQRWMEDTNKTNRSIW